MASDRRPAGRPHSVNRQAAIVCGEKTYHGKSCKHCGGTERYTKGSGCVVCQKTSAIEARQLLRAARGTIRIELDPIREDTLAAFMGMERPWDRVPATIGDIDFLDLENPCTASAQLVHTSPVHGDAGAQPIEPSVEDLDFLDSGDPGAQLHSSNLTPNKKYPEKNAEGAVSKHKNTLVTNSKPAVQPCSRAPDPEPLCPQCGCGTEADHKPTSDGWLQRTGPWRCTICDWVDAANDSLDSSDFLD